jgi:endogenous inhibitor of DNA gyrase (YacG/DUF329 family)
MARDTIGKIKCPVCGDNDADVRESKKGSPYMYCNASCHLIQMSGAKAKEWIRANMRPLGEPAPAPAAPPAPPPAPAPAPIPKPAPAPAPLPEPVPAPAPAVKKPPTFSTLFD